MARMRLFGSIMITLQINDDSLEAKKFLEFARTLPFIKKKDGQTNVAEPPCQYTTEEEFRNAVSKGMDDVRAGRVILQEELETTGVDLSILCK